MKVPKPIKVFIHYCPNWECENNRDGECHFGVQLQMCECGEYKPIVKKKKP